MSSKSNERSLIFEISKIKNKKIWSQEEDNTLLKYSRNNFSEKDKKRIKDAIAESTSQVKIDLTEMAEKQKKIIYSVAKGEIDEATLDKLREIKELKY